MSSQSLKVSIAGELWWGGFTAAITVTNTSTSRLDHWSTSFESPHVIDGAPWGARLERDDLGNGRSRYTLSGDGWGQAIAPGQSITVGFNGRQGVALGDHGTLTAALLTGGAAADANPGGVTPEPEMPQAPDHGEHAMDEAGESGRGYELITAFGASKGSMHTTHEELMGGRTPISTEALVAYNNLRAFQGLEAVELETIGTWAFAYQLTNNSQAWGDELKGVGLWYAMQGSKVGWIDDNHYAPELIATLQRTARLGNPEDVIALARDIAQAGFIDHLEAHHGIESFINTLKMEPHFGGWMHDHAHGWLPITGGAIAHDLNHLTVLSHDQTQPFMNDTFDWPQWPALEVDRAVVIDYFQSMVTLSDPLAADSTPSAATPPMPQAKRSVELPPETTLPIPMVSNDPALHVEVGGHLWWNGFTAELTVTNTSDRDLSNWSTSFISPHRLQGAPWGASISQEEQLSDGLMRYTLTGQDWARSLKAGASYTVGFNGEQLINIGQEGQLTALMLFSPESGNPQTQRGGMGPDPAPNQPDARGPAVSNAAVSNPAISGREPSWPVGSSSYSDALSLSFLFYEANRSGDLDDVTNRIPWRGDSGLRDGRDGIYFGDATPSNLQAGLSLDLTGGYHDAGDHGKFGLPLASSLTNLAWGGIAFSDGYNPEQMGELLEAVRWGTDYLLKAHGTNANGDTTYVIAQVGDVPADHALWSAPEQQTIPRPAMAITADKPGSDLAAGTSAALAAASMLFRQQGDMAYAERLLQHARSLYAFADTYRGKYSDSITGVQGYYNSWSGYQDELAYGAAWLGKAVDASGGDGRAYLDQAQAIYHQQLGGLNNGWAPNWDDASYGTAVLLAQELGDGDALGDVQHWLNAWVQGGEGVQITDGGLRYISPWGSLRYAANTAMLAGVVADALIDPNGAYSGLALDTLDYILGDNPRQSSYVVGYGDNFPQQPHHRAASGVGWDDFNSSIANQNILYGALVGGPSQANDFAYNDARSDYISNEVAIDYNAGFTSALAFAANMASE